MTVAGNLLLEEAILPGFDGSGLSAVIAELSARIAVAHGLDRKSLHSAIMNREHLGSTGIGHGVAVPHARIEGIAAPTAGFASLARPVACDATDGQPCDLIFVLVAPEKEGSAHVRTMAQVARLMSQSDVRDRLRTATSAKEILAIVCGGGRGSAAQRAD